MCCASLLETVTKNSADLVDEIQMFICPAVVGAGKRFFLDGVRLKLELVDEHRFRNGVVFLRYVVRG
jgi:dihydrofolate reductase